MDTYSLRLSRRAASLLVLGMIVILVAACGEEHKSGTAVSLFNKDRGASIATPNSLLPQEPSAGADQNGSLESEEEASFSAKGAPILEPVAPGGNRAGTAEWLVMLYLNADDNMLERDILLDLNEAEKIGSN